LEVIPYHDCVKLLEAGSVGRIATVWNDEPHITPINYHWDGSGVVFRTDPGLILHAIIDHTVVFEIDDTDNASRTGWSVIIRGRGQETENLGASDTLTPWAPGARDHWVRIEADTVNGRRITHKDELTNQWWRMSASS
jgi:nitroimidazol reductase NimA-like FMN-containing flavoprotein (pyridoxamine 5'-phosphate oxidase superfamily)